jgi:SAM-dependent methyltransferase
VTGAPDLYESRFDPGEIRAKEDVWREIVRYLQRFIDPDQPVLDVACDRGHFVRWAVSSERWATDIRDVSASLPADIRFVRSSGLDLDKNVPNGYFGTVFMSNYLEHLPTKDAVIEQFRVVRQILSPNGRVIVLQPNIRFVGMRYWDYIDHRVALTERSIVEAAELAGLTTERLTTRFLPYSTKGRLPVNGPMVRLYLAVPIAWRVMGRQTLYVGRPRVD